MIMMAVGGSLDRLDPGRDTLAYLTIDGAPVPAARFMGGREFAALAGAQPAEPSDTDIARVVAERVMALPTFVKGVGPFPHGEGRWTRPPETLSPGERSAAASLYLALVTAESLGCAGAAGPTIVEGPFARNRLYGSALAAILGRPVLPSSGTGGTSLGAAHLFNPADASPPAGDQRAAPLALDGLADYIRAWRGQAAKA
jgi:sugar (pentulose or hexulose) kinase